MNAERRARAAAMHVTLVTAGLTTAGTASSQAPDTQRLEQSRAITAEFASRLQTALQSAMSDGGPAAAISVCRDLAPQIAAELSRMSGAKVQRTSLRYRNPANAPEPWQADVLREFDRNAAQAAEPGGLEHLEIAPDASVRYMKAIRTGGICLACHGMEVAPEVDAALEQHYPHDLARGYSLGDVRGAFSITWPAMTASAASD